MADTKVYRATAITSPNIAVAKRVSHFEAPLSGIVKLSSCKLTVVCFLSPQVLG